MIEIKLEQNTKEWEEWRGGFIGASDSPIICGKSPFCTPSRLWSLKKGLLKNEPNYAMKRGKELEEEARKKYSDLVKCEYKPKVFSSKKFPWMVASIDGINCAGQIIEIKCPSDEIHKQAKNGYVPEHYIYQMNHQMYVCGVHRCEYVSYNPNDFFKELVSFMVVRSNKIVEEIIEKSKDFWDSLQIYEEPALERKDIVSMKQNPEFLALELDLFHLYEMKKSAEEQIEEIKGRLISLCTHDRCEGCEFRVSKLTRQGAIDYTKIPELKEINLEKYRKLCTEYYRFDNIKSTKEI